MTLEELTTLAKQYVENKNEADSYKKICEEESTKLKKEMAELGIDELNLEGTKITRTVSNRVTLDEDKVLAILQSAGIKNPAIIKTKQYVDMDELEKAIYAGFIASETVVKLNDAKVKSADIVTLRVTKKKGA